MAGRLLGIETEYALGVGDPPAPGAKPAQTLPAMLSAAQRQLPYLSDGGSGLFLQNGSRFYVDCGGHPEMTTPECSDPWEVVRYVQAGEAIMLGVVGRGTPVFRTNVDYSGAGSAWGTHESYLHRADPRSLPRLMIPHLVSRVVYAGAGGFNNLSAGLEFTLSPRVPHLVRDVSHDSTSRRGIFHTKDESLSGEGWHRLHLLCGESQCSELSTWLKVGVTALVVALSEAGRGPGQMVTLRSPVEAMRTFASDPTCRAAAETVQGQRLTAVDIQRRYLEHVEAALDYDCMPAWAETVCQRWRAMLDALEEGGAPLATSLDWAIKLALYRERTQRRGLPWESLPGWTAVATQLTATLHRLKCAEPTLTVDLVLGRESPLADEVRRLGRTTIREHGLRWGDLGLFLAMREELFEIDTRFGQLGDRGIFTALDAAGVLTHRVGGVGDVAAAMAEPPPTGRAALRGELVRSLSGQGARYLCRWDGVWDNVERRRVDLSDPFATVAQWKPWRHEPSPQVEADLLAELEQPTELLRRIGRAAGLSRSRLFRRDPSG